MGDEVFCRRTGHWISAADLDKEPPVPASAEGNVGGESAGTELLGNPDTNTTRVCITIILVMIW